jgi:hypothetical protein
MARLYSNENFPLPVVVQLRRAGHDVLISLEAGKANQRIPDQAVLAFAIQQGRAVITFNRRDFIRLHKANPTHNGIVVCKAGDNYTQLAKRIDLELAKHPTLQGQLVRINRAS